MLRGDISTIHWLLHPVHAYDKVYRHYQRNYGEESIDWA